MVIKNFFSTSVVASTTSLTDLHDIFYHILSHLAPDLKGLNIAFNETLEAMDTRKTSACLARTHSSFTKPALTEMWRSLPNQKALEHLLCVVGIARKRPLEQCDGAGLVRKSSYRDRLYHL